AVRGAFPHPADRAAFNAYMLDAARGDDYATLVTAHARQVIYYISANALWYFPWLIGRFLLGYYAGRRRLFVERSDANLATLRKLLVSGLVVGVIGTAMTWLRRYMELAVPVQLVLVALGELAYLGLAAVYASAIALLMERATARRYLMVLAPLGRMPLTTYLMQSAIATFLFYGWGL